MRVNSFLGLACKTTLACNRSVIVGNKSVALVYTLMTSLNLEFLGPSLADSSLFLGQYWTNPLLGCPRKLVNG